MPIISSVTTRRTRFTKQFKMIYRLGFVRTKDGYLKITASSKGTPVLAAIYLNPQVLAAAARMAGVLDEDVHGLSSSASKAWADEGLDFCCEAIELDADQLKSLGFGEDWRRRA